MKIPKLKGPAVVLGGAGCVGLFVSRILNELVPDALGIGISMFAAGALGGFVAGVLYCDKREQVARAAGRVLETVERHHEGED